MKKIAFFCSGNGTNMENLVKEIQAGRVPAAEASLVVCDKADAGAVVRARNFNVPVFIAELKKFPSKADYEQAILGELAKYRIDLICLAGYMKILTPEFIKKYRGRIINVHPALLPAFPGAHAIRDAYGAGVKETGATVHFVTEGVDEGPVILQERVVRAKNDTLETLEARIHAAEYRIYPEALRRVVSGKAKMA